MRVYARMCVYARVRMCVCVCASGWVGMRGLVRARMAIESTLRVRPSSRAQMCDTRPAAFFCVKMATILCPPRGQKICFNLAARIIEHRTVAVLRSGIARRAVRVGGVRALCAPPTRARGARRLRQTTARAKRLCAVCNCI